METPSDNPFKSPTEVEEDASEAASYPLTILAAQICGGSLALFQHTEGLLHLVGNFSFYSLLLWIGVGSLLATLLMKVPHYFAQFVSQIYFVITMFGIVFLSIMMKIQGHIERIPYSTPVTFVLGVVIITLLCFNSSQQYYHGSNER